MKCAPQVSSNGEYIAYINSGNLIIRHSGTLVRKEWVDLPQEFARKVIGLKWDKCVPQGDEDRLAVFSNDEIRTYSIESQRGGVFHVGATILPGKHDIVNVEWMSIPYDKDGEDSQYVRLIVFSISGLNATIWTSDGIELEFPSPKRSNLIQHGRNFALVARQGTVDVVYEITLNDSLLYNTYKLSGLLDVKDIKWSPSNVWVAAVENPAMGYKVGIWTVDGTPVNTFHGPNHKVLDRGGLGATVLSWHPLLYHGREVLMIGDYDERVVFLDTLNFRPIAVISHGDVYQQECCIWHEAETEQETKCEYNTSK